MIDLASPPKAVPLLQKTRVDLWWVGDWKLTSSKCHRTRVCLSGRIKLFVKLAWKVPEINPTILTRRATRRRHISGQMAKFSWGDEQRRLCLPDWAQAGRCWWVYTTSSANHLRRHASRTYVAATYHLIPHHTISCYEIPSHKHLTISCTPNHFML